MSEQYWRCVDIPPKKRRGPKPGLKPGPKADGCRRCTVCHERRLREDFSRNSTICRNCATEQVRVAWMEASNG